MQSPSRCLHEEPAEIVHTCRLCFTECVNEAELRKHFRTTHPDNSPYQCLNCSAEFDLFTRLLKHKTIHTDHEELQCHVCFVKFPSFTDLNSHYIKDHANNGQYNCEVCNKVFKSDKLFQIHKENHKDDKRYKCVECGESYNSSKYFKLHIKLHSKNPTFTCKICYKSFLDNGAFFKHMMLHASENIKQQFICCLCHFSFKIKATLKTHIKNTHVEKTLTTEKCPVCNFYSPKIEKMTLHILGHSLRIYKNKNMSENEREWCNKLLRANTGGQDKHSERERSINLPNNVVNGFVQHAIINNSNQIEIVKENTKETKEKRNKPDSNLKVMENTLELKHNKSKNVGRRRKVVGKRGNNFKESQKKVIELEKGIQVSGSDNKKRNLQQIVIVKKENPDEKQNSNCRTKLNLNIYKYNPFVKNVVTLEKEDSQSTLLLSNNNALSGKVNSSIRSRPMSFNSFASNTYKRLPSRFLIKEEEKTDHENGLAHKITPLAAETKVFNAEHKNPRCENICSPGQIHKVVHKLKPSTTLNVVKKSSMKSDHTKKINTYVTSSSVIKVKRETQANKVSPKNGEFKTEEFIKEGKFYEPSPKLSDNCCTTCLMSFSSPSELLRHIPVHI